MYTNPRAKKYIQRMRYLRLNAVIHIAAYANILSKKKSIKEK
jgi:hypothetical protein